MKSTPQDQSNKTSCKDCVFAIYEGKTQYGCMANRIEKYKDILIEAYDDSKEFYVVKQLCNLYRDSTWNSGVCDLQRAYNESSVTFDIMIECSNMDKTYHDVIKSEIQKISYPVYKYAITLYHLYKSSKEQREMILDIHSNLDNQNSTISTYFDKSEFLTSLMNKTRSSFHILLDENNISDFGIFMNKINDHINKDLAKFILASYNNKLAISSLACKLIYPNLYLDYDGIMPDIKKRAIDEKLYVEF